MKVDEQGRKCIGDLDLWVTLAAMAVAILMLVCATLPAQAQLSSTSRPFGGIDSGGGLPATRQSSHH